MLKFLVFGRTFFLNFILDVLSFMCMNILPECISVHQEHAVSLEFMRTDLLKLQFLFSVTLLLLRTKIGSSARVECSLYFWVILPLTPFNNAHTDTKLQLSFQWSDQNGSLNLILWSFYVFMSNSWYIFFSKKWHWKYQLMKIFLVSSILMIKTLRIYANSRTKTVLSSLWLSIPWLP